jgi:hypothetical protein
MLAAFWLFLYTMCLFSGVYVFYEVHILGSGTATVTSTHVVAVKEHSLIVYITELQGRVLMYLGMAVGINLLIVIVLGLTIKFRPKTKVE